MTNHAVLIAGGGPTGLMLAGELARARVDVAIVERCRCAGPDPSARYCECPSGFSCSKVVPDVSLGHAQLAGSYCIRAGSDYVETDVSSKKVCDRALANCEGE